MMPLESSARAMTLIALANALWVTEYASAGSAVGSAASRMSRAACIRRPWSLAMAHRWTSALVRIRGRTLSVSPLTGGPQAPR